MRYRLVNENFRSDYLASIMQKRGINDLNEFIKPSSLNLQYQTDLCEISFAAEFWHDICENNGKILLIPDSDVDGMTSAAIFYLYTKYRYPNIQIDYWLHEHKEHGLEDHIERLLETDEHYDLVVLPDSSSNDSEYHKQLKAIGTSCLVLDHHETDTPPLFDSGAIIVNNQLSPHYKNKELTGAGVTWQFCRRADQMFYKDNYAQNLIDLAALGIVGDMGSILEMENRYIIFEGLRNINNFFFKCLVEKQDYSMGGKVNPITVAFYIVPLINGIIRAGSMEEKTLMFEAFIDGERIVESDKRGAKPGDTERLAIKQVRKCVNSRSRQNTTLDKAEGEIEAKIHKFGLLDNKILIICLDDDNTFPSELNGLLAMRLAAKYAHPTLIVRLTSDGTLRGSGRGIDNSQFPDFKKFLTDSHYFKLAQGHPNAFGVAIDANLLEEFLDYSNSTLKNVDFTDNEYLVNFDRIATDVDLEDLIYDLARGEEIWGTKNPEPRVHIDSINITKSDITIMGKNKDTVKFVKNGMTYIKFHAADMIQELNQFDKMSIEVIGRANLNEYMGKETPQILVEHYEIRKDLGF